MKSKITLLSALVLGLFHATFAQEATKTAREVEPSESVTAGSLAAQLAMFGYQTNDPMSLVSAANLLNKYPIKTFASTKQEAGNSEKAASGTKKFQGTPSFEPAKLLADARTMAQKQKNDAALQAISAVEKAPKSRGRVYGPASVTRRVEANNSYTDYMLMRAQEKAEIAVIGDGDCDLDLYVYDENGNAIAHDDDNTDRCYVSFTPKWQGSFRIKIINRSGVYANYVLMSN